MITNIKVICFEIKIILIINYKYNHFLIIIYIKINLRLDILA